MEELYQKELRRVTRRHFFRDCGVGLGGLALASLLGGPEASASALSVRHHAPKAKNVIFLFMAGGPSQLELFDYKPQLQKFTNTPIPKEYLEGRRFAFMDSSFPIEKVKLLGTVREFKQYGSNGTWVSECLPHMAGIVDEISIIKTIQTEVPNHAPAKLYMNTGSAQFGRPSMGAWVTYGIGSEADDLPGFVVLLSGPRGPRGGAVNWGSGFLPTAHQGVPFRGSGDPILNLSNPPGVDAACQRDVIDTVNALNRERMAELEDDEIGTRIAAYEMAYRMQSSAPELMDLSGESADTLDMYGIKEGEASFGRNCLLARRLVERGTRFVQLYHTNWDHHGGGGETLSSDLDLVCRQIDQPCAALIRDLKQRGMLEDTLVIWGGEFGRTPMGELRDTIGRNHHNDCSTMWMAGGGVKAGFTLGENDELGFGPVEDPVHVHDLHATMLHLLGIDHLRLTYRFKGRDFRLTDVAGKVVDKIIA
ncbi:MAG: DUF1501 domain-containing protein [Candidatus Hydrogenedens sp.]|nr:DUF1501 domain-containing protein [Candidatus Hydrogenedens sp.]